MSRSRTHKHSEYYEGELKRLKSENRHLKKELKRLQKQGRQYDEYLEAVLEEELEVEIKPQAARCPDCGAPTSVLDVGFKQYLICSACKYRKSLGKKES